jgi:glutamine synthetase
MYLLLAGLTVAARHGFEMKNALEIADKTYVDVNIFEAQHKEKQAKLDKLPTSCEESAAQLLKQMSIYEQHDVFPQKVLISLADLLTSYSDKGLIAKIQDDDEKVMELVNKFFYCG